LDNPEAEEISIVGLGLTSILGLVDFKRLRKLFIGGIYSTGMARDSVERFTALPQLESVEELAIHDCLKFGDYEITLVAQMQKLEVLRIKSWAPTIRNFRPLAESKTLRLLDLSIPWDPDAERQMELIRYHLPTCIVQRPST
jgi:hypothetical protein